MTDKDGFKDISGKQLNLKDLFSNPDDLSGESFRVLSRFKHRVCAIIIDGLLLAVLGAIIGFAFGDRAYLLGPWGLLLGFVISVLYFGLQNSYLRKGQTVGKMLMKIQVVTADGKYLSLPISFIRAILFVSPLFVLQYPVAPAVLILIATFMAVSLFYFYLVSLSALFNRPSMRTFYDHLLDTDVVYRQSEGIVKKLTLWKGHIVIAALIVFFLYNSSWALDYIIKESKLASPRMDELYHELMQIDGVYKAAITTDIFNRNTKRVVVTIRSIPGSDSPEYEQLLIAVKTRYPAAKMRYEYNVGFMRWTRTDL